MSAGDATEVVDFEPGEVLAFPPPYAKSSNCSFRMSNKTGHRLMFKVKVTLPKAYVVRPTSGIIPPKGLTAVQIELQPTSEANLCKAGHHKFLVVLAKLAKEPPAAVKVTELFQKLPAKQTWKKKFPVQFSLKPEASVTSKGSSFPPSDLSQPSPTPIEVTPNPLPAGAESVIQASDSVANQNDKGVGSGGGRFWFYAGATALVFIAVGITLLYKGSPSSSASVSNS